MICSSGIHYFLCLEPALQYDHRLGCIIFHNGEYTANGAKITYVSTK